MRLACERHFRDLENGPKRGLVWRPDVAIHGIDFNRFLVHSKGEWAGKPVRLELWQKFVRGSVYGWFLANDLRRFRTVYEEVARKNGKTTDAATIALKGLVADGEPGAEVYSAATKKDQARLVFDEARRMVLRSPNLLKKVHVLTRVLAVDSTLSSFVPLSSDERTLDGLNPHIIVIDELHRHKSRAVLDVLDTAMGSRRQPLLWIITTAGDDNPESVYATENAYATQVLEGIVKDDSYFAYIATLNKEDRWDDPKVWIKANPNLHVSVKIDDLRRQALKASRSPPALVAFKRLRLNVRTVGQHARDRHGCVAAEQPRAVRSGDDDGAAVLRRGGSVVSRRSVRLGQAVPADRWRAALACGAAVLDAERYRAGKV